MKVAVLFDNFGPYHLARLRAATRCLEIRAIEVFGHSAEYGWTSSAAPEPFARATLFSETNREGAATVAILQRLDTALADFNPEAFAIPGWSSRAAFAAMRWSQRAGVPVIVMADSTAHDEPRVAWKEWVKRCFLRLCTAAFAAGRLHADYLVQLGLQRACITLGYDVVDNAYFNRETDRIRERSAFPCAQPATLHPPLPSPCFLASARFIAKKNLPFLLRAYACYRSLAGPSANGAPQPAPWDLVLMGDGPLRETLTTQLSTLNLHRHVHLPGFLQYPDLPAYYAQAGAFVHASTTEQWGLVVNEAMAGGLPVLVSNRCGCAPDLVQEGVNGWTFDPTDVNALAELMLKVSAPGFPLAEFGAASRRIIADWGPDRFAEGLQAAAECAVRVGPRRVGWFDRLVLEALLRK